MPNLEAITTTRKRYEVGTKGNYQLLHERKKEDSKVPLIFSLTTHLLKKKKKKRTKQTNKKHPFVPQQSESVYPWLLRKFVYQLRLSEVGSREQPVSSVTLGVLSTIQKKSSCDKHPLTI